MESGCKFNDGLRSCIYKMLFMQDLKPSLNMQSDLILVKLAITIIIIHKGMPHNDIHNLNLKLTTLTVNNFYS